MCDRPTLEIEDAVGLKQAQDASERVSIGIRGDSKRLYRHRLVAQRIGYAQFRNHVERPGSEVAGRQPWMEAKGFFDSMAPLRKGSEISLNACPAGVKQCLLLADGGRLQLTALGQHSDHPLHHYGQNCRNTVTPEVILAA
jgi:hypothetical protein